MPMIMRQMESLGPQQPMLNTNSRSYSSEKSGWVKWHQLQLLVNKSITNMEITNRLDNMVSFT